MMQHSLNNMKIDISVSPLIFRGVSHLAKKLNLSLTELYTLALTSYMTKYQENITATLDHVYEHEQSTIEPVLINAQTVSLGDKSW